MNDPILFRSVDIAVFATSLANRLRVNGVGVGMASIERFSEAFFRCQPTDKSSLYWVAKTCLVHDRRDLAAFDSVFAEVFDDQSLAVSRGLNSPQLATVRSSGTVAMRSAPDNGLSLASGYNVSVQEPEILDNQSVVEDSADSVLLELLPSAITQMADTPFDQLSAEDLTILGTWLEQVLVDYPQRLSRRLQASAKGRRIDLRATLLAARATAGEPMRLYRREPRLKPRGLVVVADVSGSMESFTRIYLHLMRSLVIGGNAEVFTFATSLRRVTVALRDKDPAVAIDRMTDEVQDRFSGTRIAGSLKQLLSSPVWSSTVRGSVCADCLRWLGCRRPCRTCPSHAAPRAFGASHHLDQPASRARRLRTSRRRHGSGVASRRRLSQRTLPQRHARCPGLLDRHTPQCRTSDWAPLVSRRCELHC